MKEEIESLLKSEAEEVRNLLNSILAKETQLTNPLILGDAAAQLYGHAKTIAALKYELEN